MKDIIEDILIMLYSIVLIALLAVTAPIWSIPYAIYTKNKGGE